MAHATMKHHGGGATSWRWSNMNKNHASATLLLVLACNQSTGLFKHFINLPDFRPGRMMNDKKKSHPLMCLQWSRQNNVFTQSQREAPLSLLSPPESCPSPESCLPEAPNQDPGRRRSVGAQVMTCALASLLTWENLAIERRKGLQAYHYYLINPYEYNIEYYHRDLAWSSNQCGLFVQFLDFFVAIHHPCLPLLQYDHISTSPFCWGSPLLRPHSARDVVGSKQPRSQGYLAHSKCLCKESTALIVFLCQSTCYLPGANLVHIFHNVIHKWKTV